MVEGQTEEEKRGEEVFEGERVDEGFLPVGALLLMASQPADHAILCCPL